MWWSRAAAAVLAAALLAGCGFRPLYGDPASGAGRIDSISVAPAADRTTQLVRNGLIDRFGEPGDVRYVLTLVTLERRDAQLVTRQDTVTRYNLDLVVSWRLFPRGGDAAIASGAVRSSASYNVLRGEYANLAAEADARRRAADEAATQIQLRVATFLDRKS